MEEKEKSTQMVKGFECSQIINKFKWFCRKVVLFVVTGQTFCHTLHIMDSRGNSVLVNKKCATEIECQASKVGCVHIDTQLVSI